MISLAHSSFELFPFPPSQPSLDFTRRRPAPTALKLGMAYQKRIPRTFRKFHSHLHPNECSKTKQQSTKQTYNYNEGSIPTGKLVLTDRKLSSIKRYTPLRPPLSSSNLSKDSLNEENGKEEIYRCQSNPSFTSDPVSSFSPLSLSSTNKVTYAGSYGHSQAPVNLIELERRRAHFDEADSYRVGIQR